MDDKEIEIDLSETYTIDMSTVDYSNYTYNTLPTSSVTVSTAGASGSLYTASGLNGSSWITAPVSTTLDVKGDATFEGDIKWKGRSLVKLLESIEDRLAILQEPSPAKLEKYAALKKAYDHYKTLERLIGED
jgi:hypothetical protein